MDWIEERCGKDGLTAVGRRVVHGGPKYNKPQRITVEMVEELRQLSPFDPEHLPEEILLTEAFHRRCPHHAYRRGMDDCIYSLQCFGFSN